MKTIKIELTPEEATTLARDSAALATQWIESVCHQKAMGYRDPFGCLRASQHAAAAIAAAKALVRQLPPKKLAALAHTQKPLF